MWQAWALALLGAVEGMDGGGPPAPDVLPAPAATRFYFLLAPGGQLSLPSTGVASYRDWHVSHFVTGVGLKTTQLFATPLLVDAELGLAFADGFQVALEGVPVFQLLGHVGVDLLKLNRSRPHHTGALTLWAGAGYEHLLFVSTGPHFYGPVASVRLTCDLVWWVFVFRTELFARVQLVSQYDEENEGEGNYRSFTPWLPNLQLGFKLGIGLSTLP